MFPYSLAAKALAVVIACTVAGWFGYRTGADHVRAGELAAEQAAVQRLQQENAAANDKAKKLEEIRAQQVVVYKDITRYADKAAARPGADRVCLEPLDVRAVNAALGAAPFDPGIADGGMPAAGATR